MVLLISCMKEALYIYTVYCMKITSSGMRAIVYLRGYSREQVGGVGRGGRVVGDGEG